jgi:hypothetical protein
MSFYKELFDKAIQLAEKGEWDRAIASASRVPPNWDVWQQFPSIAEEQGGMPDDAVHKILDHFSKNPKQEEHGKDSFLFEYASHLPSHASPETLERVLDAGKEDGYVTNAIIEHPNYKPSPELQGIQSAGRFWNDYENAVRPHHFATIQHMVTGQPVESFQDHRGNVGNSKEYEHVIPFLPAHAKLVQEAVMKEHREGYGEGYEGPKIEIKGIKGKPHVRVYRGISGNYSDAIARAAGLNHEKGEVDRKTLTVPVTHLSSWTIEPDIARRFATTRNELKDKGQVERPLVMEKWLPVEDLLHSGFHTVHGNQDHIHLHEHELIFKNKTGKMKLPSSALHVVHVEEKTGFNTGSTKVRVRKPALQEGGKSYGTEMAPDAGMVKAEPLEMGSQHLEKATPPDLGHAEVVHEGVHFKTGQPVTFPYYRRTTPAPRPSKHLPDRFQQKIEPHGRYMSVGTPGNPKDPGLEIGQHSFKNPLVVNFHDTPGTGAYDDGSWKARLSRSLKARGSALSSKIKQMGHDGIVTVAHHPSGSYVSETVDLTGNNPLTKSELNLFDAQMTQNMGVAADMLGTTHKLERTFEAARFLAGGASIGIDHARKALYQHDGDLEAAALASFGLPIDDQRRQALRHAAATYLGKRELHIPQAQSVIALTDEGADVAEAVLRAYKDDFVFEVKLGGKHSKGAMLARDQDNKTTYLLKPGSGGQSPAAGAQEESASQSKREGAFYHVAKEWKLSVWVPRAETISVDGVEYAALELLPWSFQTAEKVRKQDPEQFRAAIQSLLENGILHKLAVLDYVTGNSDRHANNIMLNDRNDLRLIDHGSAFAGKSFDPVYDKNSFVPFYMRAWAPGDWASMTTEQKMSYLPRSESPEILDQLGTWVASLSETALAHTLTKYGIDPRPSVKRLMKVKKMCERVLPDEAVDLLWVSV